MDGAAGSSEVTAGSTGSATVASTGASAASTGQSGSTASSSGAAFAWNDGWRERMASGDEKELKRLQRFATPDDVYKSFRSVEARLSSGELKSNLRKDATAEEAKAWRAENGIPETPDGYEMVFSDGTKVPDEDKETIKTFLEIAHKLNYTKEQVKAGIDWQYQNSQRQTEARQEEDKRLMQESVEVLRAEWGADYKANANRIQTNLDRAGSGLAELVLRGRTSDDRPMGSVPEVLKWIVLNEREIDPAGTVAPGSGTTQAAGIADEIAAITKMMGNRQSDYWKGPKETKDGVTDTVLAHRYRALINARDKMQARAG